MGCYFLAGSRSDGGLCVTRGGEVGGICVEELGLDWETWAVAY